MAASTSGLISDSSNRARNSPTSPAPATRTPTTIASAHLALPLNMPHDGVGGLSEARQLAVEAPGRDGAPTARDWCLALCLAL